LADLTRISITRFENAKMNATLEALVGIAKGLEIPLTELVDFPLPNEKPSGPAKTAAKAPNKR
jgi:transcriptional regulator with XRE-family HTH domain